MPPVRDVRCSLHAAADEPCDGYRRIRLFPGERLDRDFILRFRLGDATIRSTLTLHPDSGGDRRGNICADGRPSARISWATRRGRGRWRSCSTDREAWRAGKSWRPAARLRG